MDKIRWLEPVEEPAYEIETEEDDEDTLELDSEDEVEPKTDPSDESVPVAGDDADTENIISLYLHDVRDIPLLTAEQEVALAKRIERGQQAQQRLAKENLALEERTGLEDAMRDGEAAKREMVQANSRLVISLTKRYLGLGVPLLDLVQEGYLGLIKAAEKFDYRLGNKFSTYATWWIRQSLVRAVADQGRTIRLPVHMNDRLRRLRQTSLRLEQSLGHTPDLEELAAELDLAPGQVRRMNRLPQNVLSLEQPVGEDKNGELGDFVVDHGAVDPLDEVSREMLKQEVRDMMGALNLREARVLELRFGLLDGRSRTLSEVAEKFGLTRERVRQIEQEALRKLRRPGRSQRLQGYLN
jgi:RNA polymerase primary sigma factor